MYGKENDKGQWWDGKDWRTLAEEPDKIRQECLRVIEKLKAHDEYNCHVDGCFECPRCRKMHFIPSNFDLLCDGCCQVLLTHPYATKEMLVSIGIWRNMDKRHLSGEYEPDILNRYKIRESLVNS